MERRNAWLSYGENEEKEMEQMQKAIRAFWMQEKQKENV